MYDVKKNPFHRNAKSPFLSSNRFGSDEKQNPRQSRTSLGGLEGQSVEELEKYAVYESEKTTKSINGCLKIAEDIRESATKTLVTLHHQGEQISKTHMTAVGIDHDLSRGEKLLGSLGGIFSRKWKPKKTRPVSGPVTPRDEPVQKMANHFEQRGKLGLTSAPKRPSGAPTLLLSEPTNAQQKVEVEKAKQDDALSDLSNILGELKDMAIDMGSEIERQSQAMHHLEDDVAALDLRMRGANRRGRKLLGK